MVNKAQPMRIGVIGSGSWATALVKLFSNNQSHVNWWVRSEESIAHIQAYKHNPRYLQSAELEVTKLKLSGFAVSETDSAISLIETKKVGHPSKRILKYSESFDKSNLLSIIFQIFVQKKQISHNTRL